MKLLVILYVFGMTSLGLAQTSQLRYEGQIEGGSISGTLTNQQFKVSLRRPDLCGGNLGLTQWTSNTIQMADGVFTLTPEFNSSSLASAMNPNNDFAATCPTPYEARELVIEWYDGSGWETFYVPLSEAPRATYALKSQNTEAIGNVKVNPAMSCSTGQYLRFNSVGGEFTCSSIPATDVPSLNASVISSGTLSPTVVPNLVGDVTGTISSTTVEKIRGVDVSTATPTSGQVLKFNGTQWAPDNESGGAADDASYAAKGIVQINTDEPTSGLYINNGVLALPDTITAGNTVSDGQSIPVLTYDKKGRLTTTASVPVNDPLKLPLSGGTMAGAIDMGTHSITNATNVAATNVSTRNVILNDNDTNTITIKAPTNASTDYTLTLPQTMGSSGQVLTLNASGDFEWSTPGGGGGSVTQVTSANPYITVANWTTTPVITANVGTTTNTLAVGDDARIVGALQATDYATDLADVATCGADEKPSWNTISDKWECVAIAGFVADGTAFLQNGNAFGADAVIGTTDSFATHFMTGSAIRMSISPSGRTSIGNPLPLMGLSIGDGTAFDGSFLAVGRGVGSGDTLPISGSGTRMFWYPKKAAFRAGFVTSTQWDDSNIGTFSVAMGRSSAATGNAAAAIGDTATADGDTAFALGNNVTADSYAQTTIGKFNLSTGLESSSTWVLTDPLFVIGNGISSGSRNNAMTVLKNGRTGFGVSNPQTTIDLSGATTYRGTASPPPSLIGEGRIYFDTVSNKFKVSQNGSAYEELLTSSAAETILPAQAGNTGRFLTTDGTNLSWANPAGGGSVTQVNSTNSYITVTDPTGNAQITANVGTTAFTLAAGDDPRITGAVQMTDYTSDIGDVDTCTSMQTVYWNTVSDKWACRNIETSAGGFFVDGGNSLAADARLGTNDNFSLHLKTNGNHQMTIDPDGRVGIGTTNPIFNGLEIRKANAENMGIAIVNTTSTSTPRYPALVIKNHIGPSPGGYPTIVLANSRGSEGTASAIQSNDNLGRISAQGQDSISNSLEVAGIEFRANQNFDTNNHGTDIVFSTTLPNTPFEQPVLTLTGTAGGQALGLVRVEPDSALILGYNTNSTGTWYQGIPGAVWYNTDNNVLMYSDSSLNRSVASQNGINQFTDRNEFHGDVQFSNNGFQMDSGHTVRNIAQCSTNQSVSAAGNSLSNIITASDCYGFELGMIPSCVFDLSSEGAANKLMIKELVTLNSDELRFQILNMNGTSFNGSVKINCVAFRVD